MGLLVTLFKHFPQPNLPSLLIRMSIYDSELFSNYLPSIPDDITEIEPSFKSQFVMNQFMPISPPPTAYHEKLTSIHHSNPYRNDYYPSYENNENQIYIQTNQFNSLDTAINEMNQVNQSNFEDFDSHWIGKERTKRLHSNSNNSSFTKSKKKQNKDDDAFSYDENSGEDEEDASSQDSQSESSEEYDDDNDPDENKRSKKNTQKSYSCAFPECGIVFHKLGDMKRHAFDHGETFNSHTLTLGGTFACSLCTTTFKRLPDMLRHVKSIHSNLKPYVCPNRKCGKAFSRKDALKRHLDSKKARSACAGTKKGD